MDQGLVPFYPAPEGRAAVFSKKGSKRKRVSAMQTLFNLQYKSIFFISLVLIPFLSLSWRDADAKPKGNAPVKRREKKNTKQRRAIKTRRNAKNKAATKRKRAKKKRPQFPPMSLYHIHNRERLELRLYDSRGRVRPKAVHKFSKFMRSYKTGKVRTIHWRLPVVLYEIWLRFGQPQVTIYSGYRPPEVCSLKTSKHTEGEAVDFSFDGVPNSEVRDYILKYWFMVGVGFYPNSYHVHLDVRKKKTFWVDYGGPGEGARYARRPYKDVKKGIARRGYVPPRFQKKQEKRDVKILEKALANVSGEEAGKEADSDSSDDQDSVNKKKRAEKVREVAKKRRKERETVSNKRKRRGKASPKHKSKPIHLADTTQE